MSRRVGDSETRVVGGLIATMRPYVDMASRKPSPLADMDREFLRRVYDRCGASLDLEVYGEEIGHELGLDEQQTIELVARLTRTGFLRDIAAHLRIKITSRAIGLVERQE